MATPPLTRQRPTVQAGGIRRSFTQPPRSLSFHEKAGLDPSDSAADILYSHPRARIVSFTPPTDAVRSASSPGPVDLDYPVDTIETLPWASSTEDVLSSGSLIIEKIRGSTNFLRSGTKPLHALMRNSQCWCVDGEATLVMRVGAFKYYRIELPYETEGEQVEVQKLKDVLKRILRFEATPCPFKRGFHVDLPESATTPRKKGPWKRRPGSSLSSPSSASPSPLSLRKSRTQADPKNQELQDEVVSSSVDVTGGTDEDGSGDANSSDATDSDIEQDHASEDGEIDAPASILIRDGGHSPDLSPDLKLIVDKLPERPPEADRDAEEERDSTGDHVVSNHPAIDNLSSEPCAGQEDDQNEQDKETDGPCEELEAGDVPSSSAERVDTEDGDEGSVEESRKLPDQQSEEMLDSSSSISSSAIESECSPHEESVICSHSIQPPAEDSADSTPLTEAVSEALQIGTVENGEIAKGSQSGRIDSPSEVQPAPPNDATQIVPGFSLRSSTSASVDSNIQEESAEEAVDDLEYQGRSQRFGSALSDTLSVLSRADSFHSVASSEGRLSVLDGASGEFADPTPLAEELNPHDIPHHHHRREVSEMTVNVAKAPSLQTGVPASPIRPSTAMSEGPSTPSLFRSSASDSSWPEVETPIAIVTDNDLRRRTKNKRSFSPLPPSSTLLPSPPQSPRGTHLTGAILQKACNLALGKPIEVVFMLFHIFARIAGGATVHDLMSGDLFRNPQDETSLHRRNHSLPGLSDPRNGEASEEDEHGVPIRGQSRSVAPKVRKDDDADSLFDLD